MTSASAFTPAPYDVAARRRRTHAIAAPVASVRREPDAASEQVTQALMGVAATPLETAGDQWVRIRLADYEGWTPASELNTPPRKTQRVAVVTAPRAPLYKAATGGDTYGEVFATTIAPILSGGRKEDGGRVPVAMPGGQRGWLVAESVEQRPAGEPFPLRGVETAIALAHQLIGTPYLWGGVTADGIDCSGLAQLACRAGGVDIPRDADQQYAMMSWIVERSDVRLGDLLFFADGGEVTHVGLALDNMTLLHANGHDHRVSITSLDPAQGEYSALLAGMYAGARRAFTAPDNAR